MRFRRLLDLLAYVSVVSVIAYSVAVGLATIAGARLLMVVHVTFVLGFLMFGYATYLLWPSRPWETRVTDSGEVEVTNTKPDEIDETREETWFQSAIQRLPLVSQWSLPPSERLHPGLKLYAASFAVLGLSLATEVVFV